MSLPLVMPPSTGHAPVAPFLRFSTLWIQITGTWCNLECAHCINASGPKEPWLKPLHAEVARAAIREAEELGVKEIYFTGGEPFLHGDILALLALALQTAPTTVLTNGTLIDAAMADELAALATSAPYSLEIRQGHRRHRESSRAWAPAHRDRHRDHEPRALGWPRDVRALP